MTDSVAVKLHPGSPPTPTRLSYTHEAMVDLILSQPMIQINEVAKIFGYTQGWVSRLIRSDGFREMIAAKRGDLLNPIIMQNLETKLGALADQAVGVLQDKLDLPNVSAEVALKSLEQATKALGMVGPKTQVNIQQSYVVQMPAKEKTSDAWAEKYGPERPVIDVVPSPT